MTGQASDAGGGAATVAVAAEAGGAATALSPDLAALRTRVVFARTGRAQVIALRGDDARDAALWLLPSRLHLRDAQARQSLLLDEAARPIADVTVAADDESYLLFIEGLSRDAALAHVRGALPASLRPEIVDLSETHEVISVHGPWAWELVADVLGPDMTALPYLNFFRIDEGICLRAGKTGEFGYDVLARKESAADLAARFAERGEAYGMVSVGHDALALAGFESWFFDAEHVPSGATPIELQLQWRLDPSRDHLGRAALDARRKAPVGWRLACVTSPEEIRPGDTVQLEGARVGSIFRAARSDARGAWIASALLPPRLCHGGIDALVASGDGRRAPLVTVVPPLLDNHSLHVDPRRHTFRARDEVKLGPLVRPPLTLDALLAGAPAP